MQKKIIIIAEIGINHNGNLKQAKRLIKIAKTSGADIVKFQSYKTELLVTKNAKKANYQKKNGNISESLFQLLKKNELSNIDQTELFKYANKNGIEFLSSPFDLESLHFLIKMGVKRLKIPSGEINNFPLLKEISKCKLPVILSTGGSTMREISAAIKILKSKGKKNKDITVMHCTSEYPAPFREINLSAMNKINKELNLAIGYSDHTLGIEVPIAAVALGASIIEKHLTLQNTLRGPDHKASLEPKEFNSMVKSIRNIESALIGGHTKRPSFSEKKNINLIRKSIVAKSKIKKGQIFTNKNITTKRPGFGISPMQWKKIIH